MNCWTTIKALTIIDGDVVVTVALPPEGISGAKVQLLVMSVHVFTWALGWTFWAANLFQTLVVGRVRW